MGSLTNQYVSQSYQGLLKLDNPNSGITSTLQSVTDGLDGPLPIKVSTTDVAFNGDVHITGSVYVDNITSGSSSNFVVWNNSTKEFQYKTAGASGSSGTSGTSGSSGQAGQAGSSGTSGTSGSSGQAGSSGTSGTSGSSGQAGSSGTSGTSGQAGSSGTSGTSGQAGSSGTSGTSGQAGSSGTSGTSGVAGSNGTSGTSGASPFAQTGSAYSTTNNIEITGSFDVSGNTTLDGNVDVLTGNLNVYSPFARFDGSTVLVTGSLDVAGSGSFTNGIKIFTSASYANSAVQPGQFVTESSPVSQSNVYFSGNNGAPLPTNFTGSYVVSGSNNILFTSNRLNTLVTNGTYGFLNGVNNIVQQPMTITTSSVALPITNGNYVHSQVAFGFTTSSLTAPFFNNNKVDGTTTINHQSGSIGMSANVIMGTFTSTQQLTPGKAQVSTNQNIVIGTSTINHLSSSVSSTQNILAGLTVTNLVSSSVSAAQNGITVNSNLVQGSGHGIWASGSIASGTARTFTNNLIVGSNNAVTASQVGSNSGNLVASAVIGQNLIVSASHAGTVGGSTFIGRYNGINAGLDDSQNIVFAVGTGTGTSNRRTGMWIDSGSNAVVSGSLGVTGSLNVNGSAIVTGSVQGNVNALSISSNTASLNLNNGNFFTLQLVSGSDTRIEPSNIKPGQTVNILLNTTGSGTVSFPSTVKQVSGSSYVPTTTTGKDVITLVSFDSSDLYLANVKNLV
jgi:hypothetical protein